MQLTRTHGASLLCTGLISFALLASPALGALSHWQDEVASGTPAGYVATNIASPTVADIGLYSEATGGGVSYEFIVNATNDGVSSALMGTRENPAAGDLAGLKWEQWQDTGNYGATAFGVADFDSAVANSPGVDTHLVFVNNGTDTLLYVNGGFATTMVGATPLIAGNVGIGQVYDPNGNFDLLTGTIHGVAVYDAALSPEEIAAHARSFAIPEPTTLLLVAASSLALLPARRR